MSLINFIRMSTDSGRGELALVNPDERRPAGHFNLHNPTLKTAPKVKLYFAYDKVLQADALSNDLMRQMLFEELLRFYNVIESFHPFSPYVLEHIDLPWGDPLTVT
jgi:hypothetical protein